MKLSQLRRFLFMLIIKTVLSCLMTVPFLLSNNLANIDFIPYLYKPAE